MLYLNAYRVSRAYGGSEEGGWWFDVGEPIASIPIKTELARGQTYLVSGGTVRITVCRCCGGSGLIELEDDEEPASVRCEDCGEVPFDCQAVNTLIATYRELLEEELGRREELRLAVESGVAESFPSSRPHYE